MLALNAVQNNRIVSMFLMLALMLTIVVSNVSAAGPMQVANGKVGDAPSLSFDGSVGGFIADSKAFLFKPADGATAPLSVGEAFSVAVSANGRFAAWIEKGDNGEWDVWMMNLEGEGVNLTVAMAGNAIPAVTAETEWIRWNNRFVSVSDTGDVAFFFQDGTGSSFYYAAVGAKPVKLVGPNGEAVVKATGTPMITPNAAFIAYTTSDNWNGNSHQDVYRWSKATGKSELMSKGPNGENLDGDAMFSPAISPSGLVAYATNAPMYGGDGGYNSVQIVMGSQKLTEAGSNWFPVFSGDNQVYFIANNNTISLWAGGSVQVVTEGSGLVGAGANSFMFFKENSGVFIWK